MYQKYIKRLFDFICSFLGIILGLPVILFLAIAVRFTMGNPVLFRQRRITRHNRIFTMYKFRTMTNATDQQGRLLPNEARLTKLGSFLRSTSLDELPELYNVLRGDISLIGPRPLIKEYLLLYTDHELKRHKVRGGLIPPELLYDDITPSWEQQFEYEIRYANHVTFRTDCKIIFKLLQGLVKRKSTNYGAYNRASFYEDRANRMRSCSMKKEQSKEGE